MDSVTLYTKRYTSIKDSIQRRHIAAETARMRTLYSLNESLNIANKVLKRNFLYENIILIITVFVVIGGIGFYYYIRRLKQKQEKKIQEWNRTKKEFIRARKKLKKMNDNSLEQLRLEKDREIAELMKKVDEYKYRFTSDVDMELFNSEIYQNFLNSAFSKEKLQENDWKELEKLMYLTVPNLMAILNSVVSPLTKQERKLCILIRLHFNPYELCMLLNLSSSNVSMKRSRLGKKIFGEKMTPKEFDSRKRQVI